VSRAKTFTYDSLGQLTGSQPSSPDSATLVPTSYEYDPAGHLTGITASGVTTSFSIDALGRQATQTIGQNPTTTLAYLGTSNTVSSSVVSGALSAYSAIDAIGDRLTTGLSGAFAYLVPDLHGNVVAAASAGTSPGYLSAYRYDAYGETVASWIAESGSVSVPYRYQGRRLQNASGATDLYDFGARSYDPDLGSFTSFDTVSGSAQNPLTLNRYLYASANPATMIDPDGHAACRFGKEDCADIAASKKAKAKDNAVHVGTITIYHTTTAKVCVFDGMCLATQVVTPETVTFWLPEGSSKLATAKEIQDMQDRDKRTKGGGHEFQDYVDANGLYAIYAIQQAGKDDPRWKYGKGVFETAEAYVQSHWGVDDQTVGASTGGLITKATSLGKDNYYTGRWAEDEPRKIYSPRQQARALVDVAALGVGLLEGLSCPATLGLDCPLAALELAHGASDMTELLSGGGDLDNPNWIQPCDAYDAKCPAKWNTSVGK
jgi:RHS repeat-associated protein